jgi:hypothetical protein
MMEIKIEVKHATPSYKVKDLSDASRTYQNYRDENGLRTSELGTGKVFVDGKHVATVTYNGRVWDTEQKNLFVEAARVERDYVKLTPMEKRVLKALFESSERTSHEFGVLEDAAQFISLYSVAISLAKWGIIVIEPAYLEGARSVTRFSFRAVDKLNDPSLFSLNSTKHKAAVRAVLTKITAMFS